MSQVLVLSEFTRGKIEVAVGRNGLQDRTVLRDAVAHVPTNRIHLLPRRRRRLRIASAKVLELR